MTEALLGSAYMDHMNILFRENRYLEIGGFSKSHANQITIDQRTQVVVRLLNKGIDLMVPKASTLVRADAGIILYQARTIQKSGPTHPKSSTIEIEGLFKRLHSLLTDKFPQHSEFIPVKDRCCCVIS